MVMFSFRNYISKFRHYFRFSKEEIEACVISVLVMAFIISFHEWGYGNKFDFNIGLVNYIRAIFIIGIILLVQIVAIKMQAIKAGYRAEFKLWWYGLIIGLGLAFLSASLTKGVGKVPVIWFLAPGGVLFHHMAVHRLGSFRYGLNKMQMGWSCLMGIFSTIGLAVIFKILLNFFPENLFIYKLMVVSLWFAFFSMWPIPPLVGATMFYWSRLTYFFIFGIVIGFNILLRIKMSLWIIALLSLILGILVWAFILWKVES